MELDSALDMHNTSAYLTLLSLEGTHHRVNGAILRHHSELFDTVLTLPIPVPTDRKGAGQHHIIEVFERDATLLKALPLLHGDAIRWSTIEEAYPVLELAEKWDCQHLLRRICAQLSSGHIPRTQPLRFFAAAKHFEWEDEARQASAHTLSVDIQAPENAVIFQKLPSKVAESLLDLRRKRSTLFRRLLDNPTRFPGGNSSLFFCDNCCTAHPQDDLWHAFKKALNTELVRLPSGVKILALTDGGESWDEANACWEARCPTRGCGATRFDRRCTLLQIRSCIESLPSTIDP